MRNLCKAFLSLLLAGLVAEAACAQTTPTAASGSITIGSAPISTGTVIFVPVDSTGRGIAVTKAAGGLALSPSSQPSGPTPIGFSCAITAGAITGSCSVPDQVTSSPSGFKYNITFVDTSTGNPTSGYSATLTQVSGVTGSTWALDHYVPSTTVSSAGAYTVTAAVGAPSRTYGANSFYFDITNPAAPVMYFAVNGTMEPIPGGTGGGSVTLAAIKALTGTGSTAATNFGFGTAALSAASAFDAANAAATVQSASLQKSNNLSDVASTTTAAASIATFIKTQTGCTTAGNVWVPQSNTCVAPSAGGGATTPATTNLLKGTTTANVTAAATPGTDYIAPTGALAITPAVGGAPTINGLGSLTQLQRIAQAVCFGDSYGAAQGVNRYDLSLCGALQGDIPADVKNYSISGTNSSVYAMEAINFWDPSPMQTNVAIVMGDENQGSCTSATATCGLDYQETANATFAWLAIPPANRLMASGCTVTSGTVTAYSTTNPSGYSLTGFLGALTLPVYSQQGQPGTAMTTTGSAVLTCNIPASNTSSDVGITFGTLANSTSTFTVTVDGASVTDFGSGTTTFSAAPLLAFSGTETTGVYRQDVTVTPGTAHTVVFTLTGSTSFPLSIVAVDSPVPNSAANGFVAKIGTNAAWSGVGFWNGLASTMAANFRNLGLAVNFIDINGGVTDGAFTCAVNSTTDLSTVGTTSYAGSTLGNHPNNLGYELYRECTLASQHSFWPPTAATATTAPGFRFAAPNAVKTTATGSNVIEPGPLNFYYGSTIASATSIQLLSGFNIITGNTPVALMTPPLNCFSARGVCNVALMFTTAGGSITNVGSGYYGLQSPPFIADRTNTIVRLHYYLGYWYDEDWFNATKQLPVVLSGVTPTINAANDFSTITLQGNTTFGLSGVVAASQKTVLHVCQPGSGGPYTGNTFASTFHIAASVVTALNALASSTCADLGFQGFDGTNLDNTWSVFGYAP